MSHKARINLPLVQKSSHVFCAEAVPDGPQTLDTEVSLHLFDTGVDNWIDDSGLVALYPIHDLESLWWIELDGVAVEEIGHDDQVAIRCVLVCDEFGVYEFVSDYICEE